MARRRNVCFIFILLVNDLYLIQSKREIVLQESDDECPGELESVTNTNVSFSRRENMLEDVFQSSDHDQKVYIENNVEFNPETFVRGKREVIGKYEDRVLDCPPFYDLKMATEQNYNTQLFPVGNSSERIEDDIISTQTDCVQRTERNISTASLFTVNVTNCCITDCVHEILLKTKPEYYIFLDFTHFKVPGLKSLTEQGAKTCVESLQIGYATNSTDFRSLGSFCGIKEPGAKFVQHNEVLLRLQLWDNLFCVDYITFDVTISPCLRYEATCDAMEPWKANDNEGYLISPGFHKGFLYPQNKDCSVQITVLSRKLIKIKMDSLFLGNGDSLHIIPNNPKLLQFPDAITFSGYRQFMQEIILPSNECTVRFISNDVESDIGFRLNYVAVDENEFVPMFTNLSLDCSNLYPIPQFIECDFQPGCINGEDERNCSYKNKLCGANGYFYNNHCYYVIRNLHNHSWVEAESICSTNYNALLLSINTVGENNFIQKLWNLHDLTIIFLGLKRMKKGQVPQMYRRLWQWSDGNTALYMPDEFRFESWNTCTLFTMANFHATSCEERKENVSLICEKKVLDRDITPRKRIHYQQRHELSLPSYLFRCVRTGEYVAYDVHCNGISDCFDGSDERKCKTRNMPDMFECQTGQLLPYPFVCNGIHDCSDGSDEKFCKRPDVSMLPEGIAMCTHGTIMDETRVCDGQDDCFDSSDEDSCMKCSENAINCPLFYCFPKSWENDSEIDCPIRDWRGNRITESSFKENVFPNAKPPGIVYPDGYGKVNIGKIKHGEQCPITHFLCEEGFCIPIYMLCNGFEDCPYGEDENQEVCEDQCIGLYKCKRTSTCVPFTDVCNNVYNCPWKDDETMCSAKNITCPATCECLLSQFTCTLPPTFERIMPLTFLRIKNTYSLEILAKIDDFSLIFLNISGGDTGNIDARHMHFPNLVTFDASYNAITFFNQDTFENCLNLERLFLAGNYFSGSHFPFLEKMKVLRLLDLSFNDIRELTNKSFKYLSKLQILLLRNAEIWHIHKHAFNGLYNLAELDLRGNDIIKFHGDIFSGLQNLQTLMTDNFRLCCGQIVPERLEDGECIAPLDEVSSCSDLLRSMFLRISLWIMAILTITGNTGVILFRIFFDDCNRINFRIIVICLAVSDLIMGVYLIIIGVADASLRDRYLVHEEDWKSSTGCIVSGFLCLLSTEVSAMFILAATMDRLLVIALPLRREYHLTSRSASVVCVAVWLTGLGLAVLPLIPPLNRWKLYSQLPMGVPLPITTKDYPGSEYTFVVFMVFNSLIFICVSGGQLLIYLSVTRRHRPHIITESRMKQDLALAKRLALVVATDCFCWFPITVMGFLSKLGIPIPIDMHVLTTVFLLPANSALNPFLYTVNAVLLGRKRKKQKESSIDSRSSPATVQSH